MEVSETQELGTGGNLTRTAFGGARSLFPQCINIPLCRHFVTEPYIYIFIVCCHGNVEKMKGLNCDIYCI